MRNILKLISSTWQKSENSQVSAEQHQADFEERHIFEDRPIDMEKVKELNKAVTELQNAMSEYAKAMSYLMKYSDNAEDLTEVHTAFTKIAESEDILALQLAAHKAATSKNEVDMLPVVKYLTNIAYLIEEVANPIRKMMANVQLKHAKVALAIEDRYIVEKRPLFYVQTNNASNIKH